MINKICLAGLLIPLLFLTACGPGGEDADYGRQSLLAVDTLIVYRREGGIAGISQEWVIHPDGTIDGPGDEQFAAPPEAVQNIIEKGEKSDLALLSAETAGTEICCDQMTYFLTVVSGDEEWRLVSTDTADQPKEVTELFIMVQSLIAEAQPAPN